MAGAPDPVGDSFTYWDYVKLAFKRKAQVPGLGAMPLNGMAMAAFGILGFFNPGFWLLGVAVETAYLTMRSSSQRFRKLVQGERLLAQQRTWEERIHQAVERLSPERRGRYRNLLEDCRGVLGVSETLGGDADSLGDFRDLKARRLNQLLAIFLRLLTSREVIEENLSRTDKRTLEREVEDLEGRLEKLDEGADPALHRSLSGTLQIQRKRLENLDKAIASLTVIDAELKRIERQVELMREEAAVGGRTEDLSVHLDAVTTAMTETSAWMEQNAAILGGLGGMEEDELVDLPQLDLPELETQ